MSDRNIGAAGTGIVVCSRDELRAVVAEAVAQAMAERGPVAPAPELLDREACAQMLGVTVQSLDRFCREKGLPFGRVGDCKRFERSAVLAWIRAGGAQRTGGEQ